MQDKAEDAQSAIRKPPFWIRIPSWVVVVIAVFIGVAYGYFYISIITHSKKCEAFSGLFFLRDCLAQLDVNAIGDALGGAFGPLAFVFLAAALIVQSMELAAQRYEIDETQSVMAAQLEVAKQQVEETKASTLLLKQQTNILEQEQKLRDEHQADEEFTELTSTFKANLFRASSNDDARPRLTFVHGIDQMYHTELRRPVRTDVTEMVNELTLHVHELIAQIDDWEQEKNLKHIRVSVGFNVIENSVKNISEIRSRLSPAKAVKFDGIKFDELGIAFSSLSAKIKNIQERTS